MCFEKGFICGLNEKVYGAHRERFEKGQLKEQLIAHQDDDIMQIDTIPRAPSTPGSESLNPIEAVIIKRLYDDLDISDMLSSTMMRYIFHRFGTFLTSRAVRHSIFTTYIYANHDKGVAGSLSYVEQFDLSLHYLQQAIHEGSHLEILYSTVWQVVYSDERCVRSEDSAEDSARIILNHANAYIICRQSITVDIEESLVLSGLLVLIWYWAVKSLKRLDFRSVSRLPKILVDVGQLAASCIKLMPDFRNSNLTAEWLEWFDIAKQFKHEIRAYLNCWFHLNFISDGDVDDIKRLGSIIRDKLLFYLQYPMPTEDIRKYWEWKSVVFALEYTVLVEPSIEFSQNSTIGSRALQAALKFGNNGYYKYLRKWKAFMSALLLSKLLDSQGMAAVYIANIALDDDMSDASTDLARKILAKLREGLGAREGSEAEFIREFFEAACQTREIVGLEINGRGLYDVMQLLGRKIYPS